MYTPLKPLTVIDQSERTGEIIATVPESLFYLPCEVCRVGVASLLERIDSFHVIVKVQVRPEFRYDFALSTILNEFTHYKAPSNYRKLVQLSCLKHPRHPDYFDLRHDPYKDTPWLED